VIEVMRLPPSQVTTSGPICMAFSAPEVQAVDVFESERDAADAIAVLLDVEGGARGRRHLGIALRAGEVRRKGHRAREHDLGDERAALVRPWG
jgi:hypothetical protein